MPARNERSLGLFAATGVVVASLLFAGCASYKLGSPSAPAFTTVYVATVANDAFLPQSRAIVTTHVREAFARDGRVKLTADRARADRILEIRLKEYSRDMTTSLREDTALARTFDLKLDAEVTLLTPGDGTKSIDAMPVNVSVEAFTDSGQQQSEYQALPLLAEKLAIEVVHRVLDRW